MLGIRQQIRAGPHAAAPDPSPKGSPRN
jgi:hypothetical protein